MHGGTNTNNSAVSLFSGKSKSKLSMVCPLPIWPLWRNQLLQTTSVGQEELEQAIKKTRDSKDFELIVEEAEKAIPRWTFGSLIRICAQA